MLPRRQHELGFVGGDWRAAGYRLIDHEVTPAALDHALELFDCLLEIRELVGAFLARELNSVSAKS